jgi:hypothetical protein
MRRMFVAITVALGVALAASGGALADETTKPAPAQSGTPAAPAALAGEAIILHATNDGSGIDPKIGKLPQLAQPPLSSYNSYKLLDHPPIPLVKGTASPIKLPTGGQLLVTLKDILQPQKAGDVRRFVITASIKRADGSVFLPSMEVNAKAGELFFVGGENYRGGALLIGIKVNP